MASLKDVRVGETCTVSKLSGTGAIKRRIMDMGITKGTYIYVRKVAPLGDSLRKDEASCVEVTDVAKAAAQGVA